MSDNMEAVKTFYIRTDARMRAHSVFGHACVYALSVNEPLGR